MSRTATKRKNKMRKFLASTGAAAVAVIAGLTLIPAPAYGGVCSVAGCGTIVHRQGGLNAAMTIRCNYGDPNTNRTLLPGMSSTSKCADTDQVRVDDGKEIWCYRPDIGTMQRWADATGWYKIYDFNYIQCYLKSD